MPSPADEQLTLIWDPPSFTGGVPLTGYAVQYRPANGDCQDHPHSGTTASAVIASLQNGRLYVARVAAVNAAGTGDWSATMAAMPLSRSGRPRVPALTGGDAQISVSWQPPTDGRGATIDDGGLTIESYQTEYKTNTDTAFTPGPTITPAPTDGADTTYEATISRLTNGVTYIVRVTATNNRGTGSGPTGQATPLSIADQVRQLVEGYVTTYESNSPWLRAAADHLETSRASLAFLPDRGSLVGDITFLCPNTSQGLGSCELDSYGVRRRASASTVIHELAHVYSHINHVEQDPGTIAIARLYIVNTYGAGSGGCRINELIADDLTHAVIPGINPPGLTYWFYCSSTGLQGPTGAEYEIFRAAVSGRIPDWFIDTYGGDKNDKEAVWTEDYTGNSADVWTDVLRLPTSPRIAVVRKLQNFFGGYCAEQIAKAAAFSSSGRASPWAHGGCKPNAPTAVAVSRGATSLNVSWAPPDVVRGGAITHYIVQWKSADSADNQDYPDDTAGFGATARQVKITDVDTLSYEITGLTAKDTHDVRVRTANATDSSNWVETQGTVAVATFPTQCRVSALASAIEVSWAPLADNGGSAVASYVLQWKATGVTGMDQYSETERRVVITDLSHTIENLTVGQHCTVRVRATTDLGDGEPAEASATPGSPGALQDVRVDPGTCDDHRRLGHQSHPRAGGLERHCRASHPAAQREPARPLGQCILPPRLADRGPGPIRHLRRNRRRIQLQLDASPLHRRWPHRRIRGGARGLHRRLLRHRVRQPLLREGVSRAGGEVPCHRQEGRARIQVLDLRVRGRPRRRRRLPEGRGDEGPCVAGLMSRPGQDRGAGCS